MVIWKCCTVCFISLVLLLSKKSFLGLQKLYVNTVEMSIIDFLWPKRWPRYLGGKLYISGDQERVSKYKMIDKNHLMSATSLGGHKPPTQTIKTCLLKLLLVYTYTIKLFRYASSASVHSVPAEFPGLRIPQEEGHQQANIQREVAALHPAMLLRALRDLRMRCHRCITNNGAHVEG